MKTVLFSLLLLLVCVLPGNAAGVSGPPPEDQMPPVIIMDVTHPSVPQPKTKGDFMAMVQDYVIFATISSGAGYGPTNFVVGFVNASYITDVSLRNQLTGVCYQAVWPYSDMARIYVPELAGEWVLTITVVGGDSVDFAFSVI